MCLFDLQGNEDAAGSEVTLARGLATESTATEVGLTAKFPCGLWMPIVLYDAVVHKNAEHVLVVLASHALLLVRLMQN